MYDAKRFTKNGISHYDMYFIDGTPPSKVLSKIKHAVISCIGDCELIFSGL